MSRPRDTQRKRVYDSEHAVWPRHWEEQDFASIEEVQRFADSVTESRWWRSRCHRLHAGIEIRPGRKPTDRGHFHDGGVFRDAWITLPTTRRRRWYVLHELAHALEDGVAPPDQPSHGPHFCALYLELLKRFGDPGDADRLRAAFRANRVKHRRPAAR